MSEMLYKVYGLIIKSNMEIPFALPFYGNDLVDVCIDMKELGQDQQIQKNEDADILYRSPGLNSQGLPYFMVCKQAKAVNDYLLFYIRDDQSQITFVADRSGTNVRLYFSSATSLKVSMAYLLGPVIGCILRLKQKVCLHASVLNINGKAIAFIGYKTAGKSTLVSYMASLGYPVLSDDIAVIINKEEKFYVLPGYPCLRLWKNTVENLVLTGIEGLVPIMPSVEKYYFPLSTKDKQWKFQEEALPLEKIYLLAERTPDSIIEIKESALHQSFISLITNVYADYIVEGEFRNKEFLFLGAMSKEIPMKTLKIPDDLNHLKSVCNTLVADNL